LKTAIKLFGVAVLVFLTPVTAPLAAQEAAQAWTAVSEAALDPGKVTGVENMTLVRDRLKITLASGTLQFSPAVNGRVFGAAFRGKGHFQVEPPNPAEGMQLFRFTGAPKLDMEFSEATFSFADDTYEELSKQAKWVSGSGDLTSIYRERQKTREDCGMEIVPQVFTRLYSGDRVHSRYFAADFKTSENGWIHARFDARTPEEILVGKLNSWGAVTRLDTWLSFPANDRSSDEAYRDPLAREEYLLRNYQIDATVAANADLKAIARVTLEPRVEGERAFNFFLDSNLRVESVKDAKGESMPFFQAREQKDRNQSYGDYLVVMLNEPAKAGQPLTLQFTYAGKRVIRNLGGGNYFCQSFGWYPTRRNAFAARADFELTFRSPKHFTLVATGDKVSEKEEGGTRVTVWKNSAPLTVAGFAFGDYKTYTAKANTVDVTAYGNRQSDENMRAIELEASSAMPSQGLNRGGAPVGSLVAANLVQQIGEEVANTIRIFEKYYGPYPYSHLSVSNIPYSYGQGWPSLLYISVLSFLDSTQRQQLGIKEHVLLTDFFRAHEASHQWWGHRVSWKGYRDQWLSEGFAQFSGNLYVQYRQNDGEYRTRLKKDREELFYGDLKNRRVESLGPITMGRRLDSSNSLGAYGIVVYNKGGYVLNMLRGMLANARAAEPDERFMRMMQDFTATHNNKAASTEDFKAIVEKHMIPTMDLENNKKMDWFFRQYVYGTGIPTYEFKYQLADAGNGQTKLTGTITQSGVRPGWMDTLPFYVQSGGRTLRVGMLKCTEPVTQVEVTLPLKIEKVILNYNEEMLAEIKQ